ncbi:ARD-domain-containing protein [Peniophora sp. CONT]|nr:ARD-domain-containing protein [Peniophora sp. CONT]
MGYVLGSSTRLRLIPAARPERLRLALLLPPGDQRAPHDSGNPVSLAHLRFIIAAYRSVLVDYPDWEEKINAVVRKRGLKNRDMINVSKKGSGQAYESMLKMFFEEHMHEDEEIRYVLEGSGYFDLRQHNGPDEE